MPMVFVIFHQVLATSFIAPNGSLGFPDGASGKKAACQCRRCKKCGFDPWAGKIPWRRKWHPTPIFLLGRFPWTEEPGRLSPMGSLRV